MRTLLDCTSDTASRAASSGRQSTTASTPFSNSARASGSLRRAGSMEITSRSLRRASRSRICRPVVPASPSMKIVWVILGVRGRCGPNIDIGKYLGRRLVGDVPAAPGEVHLGDPPVFEQEQHVVAVVPTRNGPRGPTRKFVADRQLTLKHADKRQPFGLVPNLAPRRRKRGGRRHLTSRQRERAPRFPEAPSQTRIFAARG